MSIRQTALAAMFVLFTCHSVLAADRVYRCLQADGSSSFQQTRCVGEGESIEVDSVQSGWTSLREGEKSLLQTYRERDAKLKQRARKIAKKPEPAESAACWNKRKRLDAIQARLRRGYKPSQGEGLRRKRDNYTEYLEKFCPQ